MPNSDISNNIDTGTNTDNNTKSNNATNDTTVGNATNNNTTDGNTTNSNTDIKLDVDVINQGTSGISLQDKYGYPVFSDAFNTRYIAKKEAEEKMVNEAFNKVFYEKSYENEKIETAVDNVIKSEMRASGFVLEETVSKDNIALNIGFILGGMLLTFAIWMGISKMYKKIRGKES